MDFNGFLDFMYNHSNNKAVKQYILNILVHSHLLENSSLIGFVEMSAKTNFILDRLGFRWIALNKELIKKMLDYCSEVDFI